MPRQYQSEEIDHPQQRLNRELKRKQHRDREREFRITDKFRKAPS